MPRAFVYHYGIYCSKRMEWIYVVNSSTAATIMECHSSTAVTIFLLNLH